MARKANTGKKCIGIASPGNNSGNSISSGSLNDKTNTMDAKLSTKKSKLIQPLFMEGRHFVTSAYPSAMMVHATRQVMIMLVGVMILLKST